MATKKSYYGRDKNYSGSVSRWLGYIKENNRADSIFQQGIAELDRILDNQITFAKAREAKFKEELGFLNKYFKKMNKGDIEKDLFDMIIKKLNYLTRHSNKLFEQNKTKEEYLKSIGVLDVDGNNLLEAYISDLANEYGVKTEKLQAFMKTLVNMSEEEFKPDSHFGVLSSGGFAKEEHLDYKLQEYIKTYTSLNVDKMEDMIVEVIRKGSSTEKADILVTAKNSKDNTIESFGISSKLAEEGRLYRSGINFHSAGNTAFTLSKIFEVFNIKNYELRRLLTGFIYHSGARMTKETEGEEGTKVENIKYQQWYEYNKEFANKLAAIMASAAIGDENTSTFSSRLTGPNQVDFLYLGNKIIPKSSILTVLKGGNGVKGKVITNFYTSRFSRNFTANNHSFGYYAKKGRIGKGDSEVEDVVNQLLEKSGLRGIRIKYKIR